MTLSGHERLQIIPIDAKTNGITTAGHGELYLSTP